MVKIQTGGKITGGGKIYFKQEVKVQQVKIQVVKVQMVKYR